MKRETAIDSRISGKYIITGYESINESEADSIEKCIPLLSKERMPPSVRDIFISASVANADGHITITHDIGYVISIYDAFRSVRMNSENIRTLLKDVITAAREVSMVGCPEDGLELDPGFIFMHREQYKFCYRPTSDERDLREDMLSLAAFIIRRCDHDDKKAVDIAYSFYRYVHGGNYVLNAFIKQFYPNDD